MSPPGSVSTRKFIDGPVSVGGPHPTSGLPGFNARDYMARGGSKVFSPVTGRVPSAADRPIGTAPTQNPSAGFGGARLYLENRDDSDLELYLAHLQPGSIRVTSGQKVVAGITVLGTVWDWPNDPGRSHIHLGYEGGDPLVKLVDADGDILAASKPKPRVLLPELRRVDKVACVGKSDEAGRWQVIRGTDVLFQGKYQEARTFFEDKRAYWERRSG